MKQSESFKLNDSEFNVEGFIEIILVSRQRIAIMELPITKILTVTRSRALEPCLEDKKHFLPAVRSTYHLIFSDWHLANASIQWCQGSFHICFVTSCYLRELSWI
jgi:hypothetical protein